MQTVTSTVDLPALRQELRQARRQLPSLERKKAEQRINKKLCSRLFSSRALNIAAYLPQDGEVDVQAAIHFAWRLGHQIWLPCVQPSRRGMRFHAYTSTTLLEQESRYGLWQPYNEPAIITQRLDRVWMPVVGYSDNNRRLGMGGGFYDRCFARKQQFKSLPPQLVGIAFGVQHCDHLPAQRWDIPVDQIIHD